MKQINHQTLYADETKDYRMPESPRAGEEVTFRFRAGHQEVRHVFIHIRCREQGEHEPEQMEENAGSPPVGGTQEAYRKPELLWERTEHGYDWFAVRVPVGEAPCRYCFEVQSEEETCFYQRNGVTYEPDWNRAFCLVPGFEVPDWMQGAVMYQIFTDRFCNGDPDNDVVDGEYFYIGTQSSHARVWSWNPGPNLVGEFYGGDLAGVVQKLDYLKDLGVEVLYFNPLFVSPSNHKYDTQDYDYIDPHFGVIVKDEGQILASDDYDNRNATRYISRVTDKVNLEASNALFIELVQQAHERGMKVILDGVFNHCGSFHKWLDREKLYRGQPGYEAGAFGTADSPYRDYFSFEEGSSWPDNEQYEGWWGFETLPKLNYEGSQKLQEEIFRIAEKWVSPPYNADGWRLDVAADLGHSEEFNHEFWRAFRKRVKEANPNAVILAEHYGSPAAWLKGDEWDTVMNYDAFMEPVSFFFTGMEKHSDEYHPELCGNVDYFCRTMKENMEHFMQASLLSAMNQLSNHDHSRFLTRTNHKVGRVANLGHKAASEEIDKSVMVQAIVLQMTWPGAPTLYYGDEAGVCGFTDPDSRRTYPWGKEDKELMEAYKKAIRLHRECEVLRTGSFCFLTCGMAENSGAPSGNGVQEAYGILGFARFRQQEQAIILINTQAKHLHTVVSLGEAGIREDVILEQIFYTHGCEVSTVPISYQIHEGWLDISLPAHSTVVLYHRW
ncbi:MAG: glycoside hydrolase family 13 protein [Lachnospiraceae bacterium]